MRPTTEFFVCPPLSYSSADHLFCGTTTSTVLKSTNGIVRINEEKKIQAFYKVLSRSLKVPVHFFEDYKPYSDNGIHLCIYRIGFELNLWSNQYQSKRDLCQRMSRHMNIELGWDYALEQEDLNTTEKEDHYIYLTPYFIERYYFIEQKDNPINKLDQTNLLKNSTVF